ncbi:MAG: helix-turn-helix domain-containing protein [Nitrospinales bacterium]
MNGFSRLVDTKEAAEVLGVSPAFLERDRWRGATIPYTRIGQGKGVIRYAMVDLQNYLSVRRVEVKTVTEGGGK